LSSRARRSAGLCPPRGSHRGIAQAVPRSKKLRSARLPNWWRDKRVDVSRGPGNQENRDLLRPAGTDLESLGKEALVGHARSVNERAGTAIDAGRTCGRTLLPSLLRAGLDRHITRNWHPMRGCGQGARDANKAQKWYGQSSRKVTHDVLLIQCRRSHDRRDVGPNTPSSRLDCSFLRRFVFECAKLVRCHPLSDRTTGHRAAGVRNEAWKEVARQGPGLDQEATDRSLYSTGLNLCTLRPQSVSAT
jgi:hypothetical protein